MSIRSVWQALGGGRLRRGANQFRGQAFWRDGDGWNITLDDERGLWFDQRDACGGGIIDLVTLVRDCTPQDAMRWVCGTFGLPFDDRRPDNAERARLQLENGIRERLERDAAYFAEALRIMTDWNLDLIEADDPRRYDLTQVLVALRSEPVSEYVAWLKDKPALTRALVRAGENHQRRIQKQLAQFIARTHTAEAANAA